METKHSKTLFRFIVSGLLIMSMAFAFSGCGDKGDGNKKASDTSMTSVYEESADIQPEINSEASLTSDNSDNSDVSDEPESEIVSNTESDIQVNSSEISSEISEAVSQQEDSETDESTPQESAEETSGTDDQSTADESSEEDDTVSTIYDEMPAEVTELIEQYTKDGVLDLEAMLTEGLGLGRAQMGLYGDNYSISFCYDTKENKEAPGCIFITSRDGQNRYVRNSNAAGEISGIFRDYSLTLDDRDVMEIYYVFFIDDVSGFKKI